jgi:hypothetical protein
LSAFGEEAMSQDNIVDAVRLERLERRLQALEDV